jgi:hypothetical protein
MYNNCFRLSVSTNGWLEGGAIAADATLDDDLSPVLRLESLPLETPCMDAGLEGVGPDACGSCDAAGGVNRLLAPPLLLDPEGISLERNGMRAAVDAVAAGEAGDGVAVAVAAVDAADVTAPASTVAAALPLAPSSPDPVAARRGGSGAGVTFKDFGVMGVVAMSEVAGLQCEATASSRWSKSKERSSESARNNGSCRPNDRRCGDGSPTRWPVVTDSSR